MPAAAADYLERLAALSSSSAERADATFRAAKLHQQRGAVPQALDGFSRFVREFPRHQQVDTARLEQGRLLVEIERYEEAREILTALLETENQGIAGAAGELLLTVVEERDKPDDLVIALSTVIKQPGVPPERVTDYRLKLARGL